VRKIRQLCGNQEISFAGKRCMIPDDLLAEAEALLTACRAGSIRLAAAESCTGGLITATLTAIAGASDVVDRGFVTYSNEAKHQLVGVPMGLIQTDGAVSETVARAMAEGALARSRATIAISVTGVAGPGGGTLEKPVGLVWFGLAKRGQPAISEQRLLPGDRNGVRTAAVRHAFAMIRAQV
jgi:nicotinamide-nucleotide amidase